MKPNYAFIKLKTCKEFVIVIKRLLKYENIKDLDEIHYHDGRQAFDVALIKGNRLIIVRNPIGTTKAHMREFDKTSWDAWKASTDAPTIKGYIKHYHEQITSLGEEWTA